MRKLLAMTLAVTVLVAVPALAIYTKPNGTFKLRFFGGEPTGTLKVKELKLTELKLKIPETEIGCDIPGTVRFAAKPKLKKFNGAGGRYAYGKTKAGLLVPKPVIFKIAGDSVGGTLLLLWDEPGRTLTTAEGAIGDCQLRFFGGKG